MRKVEERDPLATIETTCTKCGETVWRRIVKPVRLWHECKYSRHLVEARRRKREGKRGNRTGILLPVGPVQQKGKTLGRPGVEAKATWNSPGSEFAKAQVAYVREFLNSEADRKNPRRHNIAICRKGQEDYPGIWLGD